MVQKDKKITDLAKDESKLMWAISEYDRKGSMKSKGVSPPQIEWAQDLLQTLSTMQEQLQVVQTIERQVNIVGQASHIQQSYLLEISTGVGSRLWLKPKILICEKILSPIKEQDKVDEMSNKSAGSSPTKQIVILKNEQQALSSIDSKSDGVDTSVDEKNAINQPKNANVLAQDLDLMNNIQWSAEKMNENKGFDDSSDTDDLEDRWNELNMENKFNKTPKVKLPCHRAKQYKMKTLSEVHSAQEAYDQADQYYFGLQAAVNDIKAYKLMSQITAERPKMQSYVSKNLENQKCAIEARLSRQALDQVANEF